MGRGKLVRVERVRRRRCANEGRGGQERTVCFPYKTSAVFIFFTPQLISVYSSPKQLNFKTFNNLSRDGYITCIVYCMILKIVLC